MYKGRKKGLVFLLLLILMCNTSIYATDLSDLSSDSSTTETEITSSVEVNSLPSTSLDKEQEISEAEALGDIFNSVGPSESDYTAANTMLEPIVRVANLIMALVLGFTSLTLMFITVMDLLYLAVPSLRGVLVGGSGMQQNQQGMGGNRMMGMPGGGDFGSSGNNMVSQNGSPQSFGEGSSSVGRWISDEAVDSVQESMMVGAQQGKTKSLIITYMKKRSIFLVAFGVCVVLFTSTVFTDLGVRVGVWLLSMIMEFTM